MPTTHDSGERRQAIWPYVVMPLAVLILYFTLARFQETALAGSQASPAHAAVSTGLDSTGP